MFDYGAEQTRSGTGFFLLGFRRIKVERLPGAESSMQSASSVCQASHIGLWHMRAYVTWDLL